MENTNTNDVNTSTEIVGVTETKTHIMCGCMVVENTNPKHNKTVFPFFCEKCNEALSSIMVESIRIETQREEIRKINTQVRDFIDNNKLSESVEEELMTANRSLRRAVLFLENKE